jgi:hypothetical protein
MEDIQNAYRIVGGELVEFEIQPEGLGAFSHGASIDYDVSIEVVLSKEDKILHYRTTIDMRKKGEAKTLATAKSVVIFFVHELEKHVEIKEPDRFAVSPDMNLSIGRVSIGFARGLVNARLKQDGISNVILPMLPFEY